jgi:type 1 glutamine amidotransferase
MAKNALIVWGGWDGHTPRESAELFADVLRGDGLDVTVRDTLDSYADPELMARTDLVVPIWTMGEISDEQWRGLDAAVRAGTGVAGFHGGMIDAFRMNTEYQWMCGAQWVSHPGNDQTEYAVDLADPNHDITRGLTGFEFSQTEQYFCHFDPSVHVLCTTTFSGAYGEASLYKPGTVMPYAWTKTWGAGRVFGACWGHTYKDFDEPTAREIVRRGMHWACH